MSRACVWMLPLLVVGGAVGTEPETGRAESLQRRLLADAPEAHVVALARAVVDGHLEADVLPAAEQVKRAEGRARQAGRPSPIGCVPSCASSDIAVAVPSVPDSVSTYAIASAPKMFKPVP